MNIIAAFFVGVIGGFLVAIPPGPLSITIFSEAVKRKTERALLVAAGGMIFEGLYSGAGFFGVQALYSPSIELATRAIGSVVLILTGASYFRSKDHLAAESRSIASSRIRLVLFGAVLTGTAPTIVGGYFILAGLARAYQLFESSMTNNLVAAFGAIVGSMVWILLVVGLITRYHSRMRSDVLATVVRVTGFLLLGVGVGLGIQLFMERMKITL